MSHLHTRFFLTLLGSLAAFALGGVVFMHVDDGSPLVHGIHSFIIFPALALCITLATYPLTRRLTQRLERLERAVESLGSGNLSARVQVEGRDEVARLAASFNRAADRIEALVGAHKTLLANASHELRTPLARIRLSAELMKEFADPRRKAGLEQDIAELDQLIGEILLASRLDAVPTLGIDEEVDLLGLAAEECSHYDDVQLEGSHVVLRGDSRLLRRMLRNLLENAQRHGVPPVRVDIAADNATAQVAVRDRGAAIPSDQAAHLFEPFYRRAEAAGGHAGAGLGLALVRQIAERHGGSAGYRASEDGGNAFFVELPLSPRAVSPATLRDTL
jgi:signal transduction histidine kinase